MTTERDGLAAAEDSRFGRSRRLALTILLLAANACAFLALRAGSAYPHVDETQVVGTSLYMETVEERPPEANWPSHVYHALRLERQLLRMVRLLPDRDAVWERFVTSWYVEMTPLHRASRGLNLVFALLALLATYRLGRLFLDRVPAALATVFVAVSPLFVNYAAFALTDMPHAFWTTVALWLAVRLARRKHLGIAFVAAAATSLAVASKYLGGLAAFSVILAWAWPGKGERERWNGQARAAVALGVIALGAAVGLWLGMPDAFRTFPAEGGTREWGLQRYLAWLSKHEDATEWTWFGFEGLPLGWVQAIQVSLPHAAGSWWLLAIAGIGWLITFRRDRRLASGVLLFAVLYFAVVGLNDILYTRYWLPFVPLIGIGIAACLQLLVGHHRVERGRGGAAAPSRPRLRSTLALICTVALAFLPARESWNWSRQIHGGDTRFFFPRMLANYETMPEDFLDVVESMGIPHEITILATGHPRRSDVPGFEFLYNPAYPKPRADQVELGVARHRYPDDLVVWMTFLERLAKHRSIPLDQLWVSVADLQPTVSEEGLRFDTAERFYEALWRLGVRHYLWSEFVDGIYQTSGVEFYPKFQSFLRMVEACPLVFEVDPLGTPRHDLPLVEAEALLSSRLDAEYAGPLLRVYLLIDPAQLHLK